MSVLSSQTGAHWVHIFDLECDPPSTLINRLSKVSTGHLHVRPGLSHPESLLVPVDSHCPPTRRHKRLVAFDRSVHLVFESFKCWDCVHRVVSARAHAFFVTDVQVRESCLTTMTDSAILQFHLHLDGQAPPCSTIQWPSLLSISLELTMDFLASSCRPCGYCWSDYKSATRESTPPPPPPPH